MELSNVIIFENTDTICSDSSLNINMPNSEKYHVVETKKTGAKGIEEVQHEALKTVCDVEFPSVFCEYHWLIKKLA